MSLSFSGGDVVMETEFYKATWRANEVGPEIVAKPLTNPKEVGKKTLEEYKDKPIYEVLVDMETVFVQSWRRGLPALWGVVEDRLVAFGN